MKLVLIAFMTFVTVQAWAECPDLTGSYRGICSATESDGKVHQYDLQSGRTVSATCFWIKQVMVPG